MQVRLVGLLTVLTDLSCTKFRALLTAIPGQAGVLQASMLQMLDMTCIDYTLQIQGMTSWSRQAVQSPTWSYIVDRLSRMLLGVEIQLASRHIWSLLHAQSPAA